MLFTNEEVGCFAKDPAVVRFRGQYILYYSLRHADGRFGVGIAVSDDLDHWTPWGEIPRTQDCEANGIAAPGAIVLNGQVHLFYQTYGNGRRDAICHAVSENGIDFRKNAENPVFRPSEDWCCGRAIDADVCVWKGRLHLYFATRDHEMRVQQIGGAVSTDGIDFQRTSALRFIPCGLPGAWNSSESGHPFAFRDEDGRMYLFYQGSSDGGKTWYLSRVQLGFQEGRPILIV